MLARGRRHDLVDRGNVMSWLNSYKPSPLNPRTRTNIWLLSTKPVRFNSVWVGRLLVIVPYGHCLFANNNTFMPWWSVLIVLMLLLLWLLRSQMPYCVKLWVQKLPMYQCELDIWNYWEVYFILLQVHVRILHIYYQNNNNIHQNVPKNFNLGVDFHWRRPSQLNNSCTSNLIASTPLSKDGNRSMCPFYASWRISINLLVTGHGMEQDTCRANLHVPILYYLGIWSWKVQVFGQARHNERGI